MNSTTRAIVSYAIITCLITSLFAQPIHTFAQASQKAIPFQDMVKRWSESEVIKGYTLGLVKGVKDGEFGPEQNLSKEQLIVMLIRSMNIDPDKTAGVGKAGSYRLPDAVRVSDWAYSYASWAWQNGWFTDKDLGDLTAPATRQEAAGFIRNALVPDEYVLNDEAAKSFDDYPAIDDRYKMDVAFLKEMDVIAGTDAKHFDPKRQLTREQGAALVIRSIAARLNIAAALQLADRNPQAAIGSASAAYLIRPNAMSHVLIGSAYALASDWDRALEQYEAARGMGNDSSQLQALMATAYYQAGDADAAIRLQLAAAKQQPEAPIHHIMLAQYYIHTNKQTEANEEIAALTRLNKFGLLDETIDKLGEINRKPSQERSASSKPQPVRIASANATGCFIDLSEQAQDCGPLIMDCQLDQINEWLTYFSIGLAIAGIIAGGTVLAPAIGVAAIICGAVTVGVNLGAFAKRTEIYFSDKNKQDATRPYTAEEYWKDAKKDWLNIFTAGAIVGASKLLVRFEATYVTQKQAVSYLDEWIGYTGSNSKQQAEMYRKMHAWANGSLEGSVTSFFGPLNYPTYVQAIEIPSSGNKSDNLVDHIQTDLNKINWAKSNIADGLPDAATWREVICLEYKDIDWALKFFQDDLDAISDAELSRAHLDTLRGTITVLSNHPLSKPQFRRLIVTIGRVEDALQVPVQDKMQIFGTGQPVKESGVSALRGEFADDFTVACSAWRISGSAYVDEGEGQLVLTEARDWQLGYAWLRYEFDKPFKAEFDYTAGGGSGADGFAFLFNKEYALSNEAGGSLGIKGGGYAITFSNYKESSISLVHNGADNRLATSMSDLTGDNVRHHVVVEVKPQSVVVTVDGNQVLDWQGKMDFTWKRLGFSGSTGALNNNHRIDNVRITPL